MNLSDELRELAKRLNDDDADICLAAAGFIDKVDPFITAIEAALDELEESDK